MGIASQEHSISDGALRLLLVGCGSPEGLEGIYLRAFASTLGVTPDFLNLYQFRTPFTNRWVARAFENRFTYTFYSTRASAGLVDYLAARADRYNIIVIFKGMEFGLRTLEHCRSLQTRALWININPDDPFNTDSIASTNQNVISALRFFDVYFMWSRRIIARLEPLLGSRAVHLPFGFDRTLHAPLEKKVILNPERVSFIGAWDPERESALASLAHKDLRIYGNGWDRVKTRSRLRHLICPRNVHGPDLAQVVGASAITLNLLRRQNAGSHNMRTFEIPAMGGLMLTNRSREQHEFFPEGEACFMFEDPSELSSKVDFIIRHPHLAAALRARGKELSGAHSYTVRALHVLDVARRTARTAGLW